MDFFKKKSLFGKKEENFNRGPLRSQSQCTSKKKGQPDPVPSRSQSFTIGLPVYNIEHDPLGTTTTLEPPLSQASSGYLSINGEVTTPTDSNVSLYSEQKSDYGGSTSTVSGVSSVDSETLNVIYASRYGTVVRKSQNLERQRDLVQKIVVQQESVPFPGCAETGIPSSVSSRSKRRQESVRSDRSSRSASSRSESIRSSRSTTSRDSGRSSRSNHSVRSPESVRSYRSTSSGSSSSSRSSRVRYADTKHGHIREEPDPYFTKGLCSSFREDGSAEVRVRASPDMDEVGKDPRRKPSRSSSFRRSRPCLSMLKERDAQSLEGLDRIDGQSTLDRKSKRDTRSVGNLVQASIPSVPCHYESKSTLKRNAKSVGSLLATSRENLALENSFSTGDLLDSESSGSSGSSKKDAFFKRGIFKLFRRKSDADKKKDKKLKMPKSKSSTLELDSRRGSADTLTLENVNIIKCGSSDTLKSAGTSKCKPEAFRSRSNTLESRDGTLTREGCGNVDRGRTELRDSRDFDRNDSLERAINSASSRSGTLTRDNCGDRRSQEIVGDGKVGALNAILKKQNSTGSNDGKKRPLPPVPPHRTTKSKSTYQILDEMKAQNEARRIEALPLPDEPKTPEHPVPTSPAMVNLKRNSRSRDSRSLGALAQGSDTLRRHNSRSLEDLDETYDDYDLPPPPEELLAMGVENAPRPTDLPIAEPKPLKGILKNKTPIEELSPRDLKNTLNEPFYAKSQQRKMRPKCPPPVPPHRSQCSQDHDVQNELGQVKLKPTPPPVPVHQNNHLQSELQNVRLRKRPEVTSPKPTHPVHQSAPPKRHSEGNVLSSNENLNNELQNVVLRRTKNRPSEHCELPSQIQNVVLRRTQNSRSSLRNSIVMDPAMLAYGQSHVAVVHQSKPNTIEMVRQPRPQPGHEAEKRNSVFDALSEHSDTIRKMTKPEKPRKPTVVINRGDAHNESVYGIMDKFMESRKSVESQKSTDSEFDFPPPPPPVCDYNKVVDC